MGHGFIHGFYSSSDQRVVFVRTYYEHTCIVQYSTGQVSNDIGTLASMITVSMIPISGRPMLAPNIVYFP